MRNMVILTVFLVFGLVGATAPLSFAEEHSDYLSETEAKRIYEAAAMKMRGEVADVTFSEMEKENPKVVKEAVLVAEEMLEEQVVVDENPVAAQHDVVMGTVPHDTHVATAGYVALGDIKLAIDVENKTIRQIMDDIIIQGRDKAGPWHIKWRLRKENEYLLNEKVNLTAESNFNEFVNYLVDRVNNMTGIHLFVTMFDASRIIVISDTYY